MPPPMSTSSTLGLAPKMMDRRPCSCLQQGTECRCSSDGTAKYTIRLEPWAYYKTVAFGCLLGSLLVWLMLYIPLIRGSLQ
ncbi:uncharacterized protein TNIN_295261 [Trichonephila inaurata madagascariensis]|uniref:Uncharacterized protein n=1 Tax=Trichonephila inaurata madagascariensis TaxID=2747483 RepID=A0A8X6XIL2_9ARAC|nr:uncharacterized protein TNIN_295261 [Trichonephila inaurata madagascariensis]